MKNWKKLLDQKWFAYCLATCSAVVLYMFLSRFSTVVGFAKSIVRFIMPVIVGAIIGYMINPIAVFFETNIKKVCKKEGLAHIIGVVIALLITISAVVLLLVAVIPSLASNLMNLASNADKYMKALENLIANLNLMGFDNTKIMEYIVGFFDSLVKRIPESIGTIVRTSMSVGSSVVSVVIGFIIAVYLLIDKARVLRALDRLIHALFPEKTYGQINAFLVRCDKIFKEYIGCNLVDALIIGVANAIFMLILRMPYVSLISVIVGVTNLLPTVGPIIGGVIGGFILLLNSPMMALWFIIFTVILQFLDGYVIKPKLFGEGLGIPAVVTLISIILGGKLYGIVGILLAIPVVTILIDLYNNSLIPWLERKKDPGPEEDQDPS